MGKRSSHYFSAWYCYKPVKKDYMQAKEKKKERVHCMAREAEVGWKFIFSWETCDITSSLQATFTNSCVPLLSAANQCSIISYVFFFQNKSRFLPCRGGGGSYAIQSPAYVWSIFIKTIKILNVKIQTIWRQENSHVYGGLQCQWSVSLHAEPVVIDVSWGINRD